jgi:hypothetical protein
VPGLGRLPSPDSRDRLFPLRAAVPRNLTGYRYWWDSGAWLDQGNTGTCVGHGWAHWVEDAPRSPMGTIDPIQLYRDACLLDVWPENDDQDLNWGTSVRGGAQALMNRGVVSSYLWAFDLQTVVDAVLSTGPVVVGTNWYGSMFLPRPQRDATGVWRTTLVIEPGAQVAGGHCYTLNGVSTTARVFRLKNSWGRGWGAEGRASVGFDDMARLIEEEGEACMAVQR